MVEDFILIPIESKRLELGAHLKGLYFKLKHYLYSWLGLEKQQHILFKEYKST